MAASAAPCASTDTTSIKVAQTAWQRQGRSDEACVHESDRRESENGDLGQNTFLEKTHEFFQMCDNENKGFITRRDMQVSLLNKFSKLTYVLKPTEVTERESRLYFRGIQL